MPILQQAYRWDFTSTGTGKFIRADQCMSLTFGAQPSTNSTATVQILHRMGTTSVAGDPSVLSTIACATTGALVTDQFLGPLEYVAPRVVDKTAGGATNTVTVYLRGV